MEVLPAQMIEKTRYYWGREVSNGSLTNDR